MIAGYSSLVRSLNQLAKGMAKTTKEIKIILEEILISHSKFSNGSSNFPDFENIFGISLPLNQATDIFAQLLIFDVFIVKIISNDYEFFILFNYINPKVIPDLKTFGIKYLGFKQINKTKFILESGPLFEFLNLFETNNLKHHLLNFQKDIHNQDPIIYLYELFLKFYSPKDKLKLGVFYTPMPIVEFMVESLDYLIKSEFKIFDGLLNFTAFGEKTQPIVQILDPAQGTGTFLIHLLQFIREEFEYKFFSKSYSSQWNQYIRQNLLPRIYGFELMIIPYFLSLFKIHLKFNDWNTLVDSGLKINFFRINSLEDHSKDNSLQLSKSGKNSSHSTLLNSESDSKILVIIGNPPYSGHSKNNSLWINNLLRGKIGDKTALANYFEIDGEPLNEKNSKWLNDDYVKFIRLGHWLIENTDQGILAYITNHSFIDNPTFCGMRQQLMKTFDKIYILDLHGNIKKRKNFPDGSKDENVFDIQQGVCISFFVKKTTENNECQVYHKEIWGSREKKYNWLINNNFNDINWTKLDPKSKFYFFIPKDTNLLDEYNNYKSLTNIFTKYSLSVQTHRDKFVINLDEKSLIEGLEDFRNLSLTDNEIENTYKLKDSKSWSIKKARKIIATDKEWKSKLRKVLYRPFDDRYYYDHPALVDRQRAKIMKHMEKPNLGLLASRQQSSPGFFHVFVTNIISESCVISNKTKEGNYHFPLYLYNTDGTKSSNFKPEFETQIQKLLNSNLTPNFLFNYIYAILHSNQYRKRYQDFLVYDFPKIPFPSHPDLFIALLNIGSKLIRLHLLNINSSEDKSIFLEGKGNYKIQSSIKFSFNNGRLYINKSQYFIGISYQVYKYKVGCYQVCDKWLKDRKNRVLLKKDIIHFKKMVIAINETLKLVTKIDRMINKMGGWPIK